MTQEFQPPNAQAVPNYLVASILMTLCCFTPGGIAAVVFSVRAKTKAEVGNFDSALEDARLAKKILWISLVIGVILTVGLFAMGGDEITTSP